MRASGWAALAAALIGCAGAQRADESGRCKQVGDARDADLQALLAEHGAPLLLVGDAVLHCSCPGRMIAGVTERRRTAGETERRDVGGDVEKRALGGADEQRQHGAAGEERRAGGTTENRDLGGADERRLAGGAVEDRERGGAGEERNHGGVTSELMCDTAPACDGFVVAGSGLLRIHDAGGTREARGRCVD